MTDGDTFVYDADDGGAAIVMEVLQRRQEEYLELSRFSIIEKMPTTMEALSYTRNAMFSFRTGIMEMTGSFAMLSGVTAGASEMGARLRAAVMLSYVTTMAYTAVIGLIQARTTGETIGAAAETTQALMNPVQWPNIAIAVGAVALMTASLAVGYEFGSGEWSFDTNPSTPQGRRQAMEDLGGVRTPKRDSPTYRYFIPIWKIDTIPRCPVGYKRIIIPYTIIPGFFVWVIDFPEVNN